MARVRRMETLHEALEEAAEILQSAQSQPSSTELSVAAKDIPRAACAAASYLARQGKRQRTQTLQLGDFSDVDDTYWQQDQSLLLRELLDCLSRMD